MTVPQEEMAVDGAATAWEPNNVAAAIISRVVESVFSFTCICSCVLIQYEIAERYLRSLPGELLARWRGDLVAFRQRDFQRVARAQTESSRKREEVESGAVGNGACDYRI